MNDEMDYKVILGNSNNVIPSKSFGRGLIKIDNIVEFQTAYAFPKETLYDNIKQLCVKLFMEYKMKARNIPVLPEAISFKDININKIDINNVPVGLVKKSLGIASLKLEDFLSYLISARSFDDLISFVDKLLYILNDSTNFNTFVFDSQFIYEENKYNNLVYSNNNYSNILNKINDYSNQIDVILRKNSGNKKSIKNAKHVVCVILGLEKYIKSLNDEDKKIFENIINKSKDSLKIHFIFVDSANSMKKYEYETWYKDSVDSSSGLWIGDGFAEQYIIKPTKLIQSYYDLIGNNYGYLVSNGNVDFIKIIEKE